MLVTAGISTAASTSVGVAKHHWMDTLRASAASAVPRCQIDAARNVLNELWNTIVILIHKVTFKA
jgi:hypothetical protein